VACRIRTTRTADRATSWRAIRAASDRKDLASRSRITRKSRSHLNSKRDVVSVDHTTSRVSCKSACTRLVLFHNWSIEYRGAPRRGRHDRPVRRRLTARAMLCWTPLSGSLVVGSESTAQAQYIHGRQLHDQSNRSRRHQRADQQ
jgi:hypothetical protein